MNVSQIGAALDERHAAAKAAFASRDLDAYRNLFSKDLSYCQPDGRSIDRTRLMRDVKTQLKRLHRIESKFIRESLEGDGSEAIETLAQTARAEATAFGFLHRIWNLERRLRYTWVVEDGEWRIIRVEVLDEKQSGTWRLGL